METTLDGLLNKRVQLEQPAQGYRVAVDTVLLAASVPAQTGENVLDLGCGVGGAMLCLAARVQGLTITGMDIQPDLVRLCHQNIERNKFDAKMNVIESDVTKLPVMEVYDHAFMNPPYHDETTHDVSPDDIKRIANTEKKGDLKLWMTAAARSLKAGGWLTLIYRADRFDEILKHGDKPFGNTEILLLLSKRDAEPKRVIIRMQRGAANTVLRCKPSSFTKRMADIRMRRKTFCVMPSRLILLKVRRELRHNFAFLRRDYYSMRKSVFLFLFLALLPITAQAKTLLPQVKPIVLTYDIYVGGAHLLTAEALFQEAKTDYRMRFKGSAYGFWGKLFPWQTELDDKGPHRPRSFRAGRIRYA